MSSYFSVGIAQCGGSNQSLNQNRNKKNFGTPRHHAHTMAVHLCPLLPWIISAMPTTTILTQPNTWGALTVMSCVGLTVDWHALALHCSMTRTSNNQRCHTTSNSSGHRNEQHKISKGEQCMTSKQLRINSNSQQLTITSSVGQAAAKPASSNDDHHLLTLPDQPCKTLSLHCIIVSHHCRSCLHNCRKRGRRRKRNRNLHLLHPIRFGGFLWCQRGVNAQKWAKNAHKIAKIFFEEFSKVSELWWDLCRRRGQVLSKNNLKKNSVWPSRDERFKVRLHDLMMRWTQEKCRLINLNQVN